MSIFLVDIQCQQFEDLIIWKKNICCFTLCCGKYCMRKFCVSLREHPKSIIDFEKKKMLPLTRKELKSHEDEKVCYICRIRFLKNRTKNINYRKVKDHCHYTGA